MRCKLRFLGFILVLFTFGTTLAFAQTKVRIAILSFESTSETVSRWQPTANYLESAIPDTHFEIIPLGYEDLNAAIKSGTADFVFTNPEHYVVLRNVFRVSPIQNIQDIRGKRVAAVGLYSLGGFLTAADTLRKFRI